MSKSASAPAKKVSKKSDAPVAEVAAVAAAAVAVPVAEKSKKAAAAKPAAANGKSATPPGPGEHAVAKGETLSSIAKKSGISLKAIQDLNPGVDATKLRIGQKLKTK